MKYTLPFGCMLGAYALLSGCQTNMMHSNMGPAQTNAQIIEDVIVLDQGEIAAAKIAKKRATHPQVKRFATYLYDQHTTNLHQTMKLSHKTKIKPEASMTADNLKNHGRQEMTALEASSRANFDKNYIDAMIKDHQAALQLLDRAILDSTNPMLTKSLQETRKHVAMHLEKAQQIQMKMGH